MTILFSLIKDKWKVADFYFFGDIASDLMGKKKSDNYTMS